MSFSGRHGFRQLVGAHRWPTPESQAVTVPPTCQMTAISELTIKRPISTRRGAVHAVAVWGSTRRTAESLPRFRLSCRPRHANYHLRYDLHGESAETQCRRNHPLPRTERTTKYTNDTKWVRWSAFVRPVTRFHRMGLHSVINQDGKLAEFAGVSPRNSVRTD